MGALTSLWPRAMKPGGRPHLFPTPSPLQTKGGPEARSRLRSLRPIPLPAFLPGAKINECREPEAVASKSSSKHAGEGDPASPSRPGREQREAPEGVRGLWASGDLTQRGVGIRGDNRPGRGCAQ